MSTAVDVDVACHKLYVGVIYLDVTLVNFILSHLGVTHVHLNLSYLGAKHMLKFRCFSCHKHLNLSNFWCHKKRLKLIHSLATNACLNLFVCHAPRA